MLPRYATLILGLSLALLTPHAFAQGSAEDYARAAALGERYRGKVVRFRPDVQWLENGQGLWWAERTGKGEVRYVRIDLPAGKRREGTDPEKLGLKATELRLEPLERWSASRGGGEPTTIEFYNQFDRPVRLFWVNMEGGLVSYGEVEANGQRTMQTYARHVFVLDFAANDLAGIFEAKGQPMDAFIDETSQRAAMGGSQSDRKDRSKRNDARKDPRVRLEIRDHNIVALSPSGTTKAWTTDGTAEAPYEGRFHWSPNGERVLAFQTTRVETRRIPLIDSRPDDQVQPKWETIAYRKPGDPIPQRKPRLFDARKGRAIPVDEKPFTDSYSIGQVRWAPDSSQVSLLYNQRGHQLVALRAIESRKGQVKTLVEERSDTFVDYSQKLRFHWLEDGHRLLWTSERDGHNHLYLIDTRKGRKPRQLTKGAWQVRAVERIDEETGVVFFRAMGIHPGADPYYEHWARVDMDGKNLRVLTEPQGHHTGSLSPDGRWLVDRWSRVDQPPITELRSAEDGTLVAELGRDDASALFDAGYVPPERFVAKGRDGTTDIYGIITRPSNFDPARRYPVIEQIYAGPHDHFVPKAWGLQRSQRRLAELGFLVVQIDGMGTNWRGKAFHDVCWQNLKDTGLPDRIAWMRAAAQDRPEMDLERVGIYGGSAGGQSALAALLHHGDFYDAAASDCGCHDNRMDKIWWNEAWMGRMGPHYADNSNVTHAHKLQGKLLLTVGELDRNVDPTSTLQVVDALIAADKDFDFVWAPGAGHGVGEGPYLFRRRQDFFVRALYGLEPRH